MKGKAPENLRTAWMACAHRMGYFCAENTEKELSFDGFMYRKEVVIAVKLKKVRYSPGEDFHLDKKSRTRFLPCVTSPCLRPSSVSSGSAPRTSGHSGGSGLCPGQLRSRSRRSPVTGTGIPTTVRGTGSKLPIKSIFPSGEVVGRVKRGWGTTVKKPRKCPDWRMDDPVFRPEWK